MVGPTSILILHSWLRSKLRSAFEFSLTRSKLFGEFVMACELYKKPFTMHNLHACVVWWFLNRIRFFLECTFLFFAWFASSHRVGLNSWRLLCKYDYIEVLCITFCLRYNFNRHWFFNLFIFSPEPNCFIAAEIVMWRSPSVRNPFSRTRTCHLLCKRPGCHHSTSKTHVRDRIFKLSPIHASVIYQIHWIPRIHWIQWKFCFI